MDPDRTPRGDATYHSTSIFKVSGDDSLAVASTQDARLEALAVLLQAPGLLAVAALVVRPRAFLLLRDRSNTS
jgi:hypothetical protein